MDLQDKMLETMEMISEKLANDGFGSWEENNGYCLQLIALSLANIAETLHFTKVTLKEALRDIASSIEAE